MEKQLKIGKNYKTQLYIILNINLKIIFQKIVYKIVPDLYFQVLTPNKKMF